MIVLDCNDPSWSTFVQSCSDALPFHHPSWLALLADCYRYPTSVLVVADNSGQIISGLPMMDVSRRFGGRRWISLPFTDYCPVLSRGSASEDLASELVAAVKTGRLERFELRAGLVEQPHVYVKANAVRHTLALSPNAMDVYHQFSKMHQRNIRKAEQSGVQIRSGSAATDIQVFYGLHLKTRRRLGVPIQPHRFFQLLLQHIIEPGLGFVLSAEVEGQTVAASVFLAWNGTLVYKYGASDQRFWRCRPNNLLFWTAIRWGCENGYRSLDWGRTDLDDEGLRQFKRGWGAKEEPLRYSVIANTPTKNPSGRLHKAMSTVIRRSPPWVCRALGELFYKYAA